MNVRAIKTRVFKEGEDLVAFIKKYVPNVKDGSVLVVTSKIVALAEGRVAPISGTKARDALIRAESDVGVKTKLVWLTIKDGMFMTSAGIDASNANGKYILLPPDSYASAHRIRKALKKHYRVKRLGVLITDSRCLPLRAGAVGLALGYAGFKGIRDYRGTPDIFGRNLQMSRTDIADGLASAAVVLMGEGRERTPLALIEDAPAAFVERINRKHILIPFGEDMSRPLFKPSARASKPRRVRAASRKRAG